MNPNRKLGLRVSLSLAAGLVATCWIQAALSAEATQGPVDPEAMARENWGAVMAHSPTAPEGCFHASYPSFVWEQVECNVAQPRVHPVRRQPTQGGEDVTGNGNDYVAKIGGTDH
jgi:hypothetical protein